MVYVRPGGEKSHHGTIANVLILHLDLVLFQSCQCGQRGQQHTNYMLDLEGKE